MAELAEFEMRDGSVRRRKVQCFVTEFHPQTVQDMLTEQFGKKCAVPENLLLRILVDVGRALLHCFQNGVLHFDLKLNNVLWSSDCRAVLCDFGCATRVANSRDQHADNYFGVSFPPGQAPFGNMVHISPEGLNAAAQNTTASMAKQPVFELGVLGFEIATNDHALADYPLPFMSAGLVQPYGDDSVADLSQFKFTTSVASLLRRMVRFDPAARPALADTVCELERCLSSMAEADASHTFDVVDDFSHSDKHIQAKVLLMGSMNAGKSCLLAAMNSKSFRHTDLTIGIDCCEVTRHNVTMQTWDVAGSNLSMLPAFWSSTAVLVLVYDATDVSSLQTCKDLRTKFDLTNMAGSLVVVATKTDLLAANKTTTDLVSDGTKFARDIGARGFARLSSKTGFGVAKFVQLVAFCCCKSRLATCDADVLLLENKPNKKSCCAK